MKILLNFFIFTTISCRILQERDPKIDQRLLESVLTDVVEHSMGDLREKLKKALYQLLFPREQREMDRKISDQEEQLVATFINQLMEQRGGQRTNDDPRVHQNVLPINRYSTKVRSSGIKVDVPKPMNPHLSQLEPTLFSDDPIENAVKVLPFDEHSQKDVKGEQKYARQPLSHKMTVALETVTTRVPTRIVTVDELRLADVPRVNRNEQKENSSSSSIVQSTVSRMPLWILIFVMGSIIFFGIVCVGGIIYSIRVKTQSHTVTRMPDPLTISGFACVPDCDNGPGSFLERMKELHRIQNERSRGSRERESESIWRSANSVRTSIDSGGPRVS